MAKNTGFLSAHRLGRKIVKELDLKSGLCAFGIQGDMNEDYDYQVNAACHAGLNRMNINGKYTYMVDAIYPRGGKFAPIRIAPEVAKMFTTYVLKKSPYSKMFAEKNIHKGFARGYYLYNTDVDANILTGGAVLLRMLSEEPRIPLAWYKLVKAGADPDMAVLLAHMVAFEGAKFGINNYSDDSHRSLVPTWFNKKNVEDFVNRKHKVYGLYNAKQRYQGFNGMWGERRANCGGDDEFGTTIYREWLQALREMDNGLDVRVAYFDHAGQAERDGFITKIPTKKAMPIIVKILNDYRGGLNVA